MPGPTLRGVVNLFLTANHSDLEQLRAEIAATEATLRALRIIEEALVVKLETQPSHAAPLPPPDEPVVAVNGDNGKPRIKPRLKTNNRQSITAGNKELSTPRLDELASNGTMLGTPRQRRLHDEAMKIGGRTPSDETTRWRQQIARLLSEDGPMPATVIRNRLDIPDNRIHHILDYPWFIKGPSGYSLTPAGGRFVANKEELPAPKNHSEDN